MYWTLEQKACFSPFSRLSWEESTVGLPVDCESSLLSARGHHQQKIRVLRSLRNGANVLPKLGTISKETLERQLLIFNSKNLCFGRAHSFQNPLILCFTVSSFSTSSSFSRVCAKRNRSSVRYDEPDFNDPWRPAKPDSWPIKHSIMKSCLRKT
jgi:hypothetical protein